MVNRVMLRKLARDLLRRKGSLLTLVVIVAIGVGCFVGMASVYRDMESARAVYYRDHRLADFTVDLKRAPRWAVQSVEGLPNVAAVRGRVSLGVLIDLPGVQEPISGRALSLPTEHSDIVNNVLLRSGTWFSGTSDREVIVNEAFARENGLHAGSRLKVLLLDRQHELLVVGTAMSPEFVYVMPPSGGLVPDPKRFGVLYFQEDFLAKACDLDGAWNQVVGLVYDPSRTALDNTLSLIEDQLDAYGVTITTPIQEQASARFLADELHGLKVSATVMPSIFLGVAALVLNVLMSRMVAQQRTVIGTLKALGYTTGFITRHYLCFGAAVGVAGGLTGVVLGGWIQLGMAHMYRQFYTLPSTEAHSYPGIIAVAFTISVLFSLAGTLKGVRAAARLEPAQVMRPPPPEKGARVLPERIAFLWRPLPFRWKMILRAVFRNPFRSSVSALAAFVSTAVIFMALSNRDALNYLMNYEFEKVSHQDVTIALRDPEGKRSPLEIARLPGVSATEPQLQVVCDLSNGPYKKRVAVTGIGAGNRLYTPLDGAGEPIVVPDAGLVLTRKLADILSVRVGDKVRLRALVGRRLEVETPVMAIVDTFLGLSAYAEIGYLNHLLGEEWSANVVLGSVFGGSDPAGMLSALKKRPAVVGIGERSRTLSQLHETFGQMMGTMITIMILFAGLIAFGSVLNTALVSLSEREREVGTLRVLGYTPSQILEVFSGESLLVNGLGIVLGLMGGVGFAHLLSRAYDTELYRFPVVIRPSQFLVSAFLMTVFVGLAQLLVYRMIRRLQWLDVLKIKE